MLNKIILYAATDNRKDHIRLLYKCFNALTYPTELYGKYKGQRMYMIALDAKHTKFAVNLCSEFNLEEFIKIDDKGSCIVNHYTGKSEFLGMIKDKIPGSQIKTYFRDIFYDKQYSIEL